MKTLLIVLLTCLAFPAFGATCKISEYTTMITDRQGRWVPVAMEPATVQTVTYTTETDSAAFAATTRFIRIVCDAKAHYIFSSNSTAATASSPYLVADTPEYFGLRSSSLTISFYDGSS